MKKLKKSATIWTILGVSSLGLVIAYILFRYWKEDIQAQELNPDSPIPMDHSDTSGEMDIINKYRSLRQVANANNVIDENYIMMLMAQAMHETAEDNGEGTYVPFTSHVFETNNNAFGMRQPSTRKTTSLGDMGGYASYTSFEDSVTDRILWDNAKNIQQVANSTDKDGVKTFVTTLKDHSYFTASYLEYFSGVNKFMGVLKSLLAGG